MAILHSYVGLPEGSQNGDLNGFNMIKSRKLACSLELEFALAMTLGQTERSCHGLFQLRPSRWGFIRDHAFACPRAHMYTMIFTVSVVNVIRCNAIQGNVMESNPI